MTKTLMRAALILSLASLSAAWGLAGAWPVTLACLVILLIGLSPLGKFQIISDLVLILSVLAAALGLWLRIDIRLALMGVLLGLAAWDLQGFARRLVFAAEEDHPGLIEQRHYRQLALILLAGAGVIFISHSISFEFSFDWTLLLAVLAFFGISALVYGMRPAGE